MDTPVFTGLFSLNMLINNPAGRSYAEGEIRDMLGEAGVRDIVKLDFQGRNDSTILCGAA